MKSEPPKPTRQQQELLDKLHTLVRQHRIDQQGIGIVLRDLRKTGYPVELVIRDVLNKQYGMGIDEARCCLRWADGEFGAYGLDLMNRVGNKGVLARIPADVLADAIAKPHAIESRHARRVVSKRLLDMTPQEICDHLTRTGVRKKRRQAAARRRRFRAVEHEVCNGRYILKCGPHCSVEVELTREQYEAAKRYFEATANAA